MKINVRYKMISFEKFSSDIITCSLLFQFFFPLCGNARKCIFSLLLLNVKSHFKCVFMVWSETVRNAYKCHHLNFYGDVFACIRIVVDACSYITHKILYHTRVMLFRGMRWTSQGTRTTVLATAVQTLNERCFGIRMKSTTCLHANAFIPLKHTI